MVNPDENRYLAAARGIVFHYGADGVKVDKWDPYSNPPEVTRTITSPVSEELETAIKKTLQQELGDKTDQFGDPVVFGVRKVPEKEGLVIFVQGKRNFERYISRPATHSTRGTVKEPPQKEARSAAVESAYQEKTETALKMALWANAIDEHPNAVRITVNNPEALNPEHLKEGMQALMKRKNMNVQYDGDMYFRDGKLVIEMSRADFDKHIVPMISASKAVLSRGA